MSYIAFDFECPNCGTFDALISRSESAATSSVACPSCHADSERVLSPVKPMTVWGYAATRGSSSEAHPNPVVLNTRPLADGQKYSEWKKQRREFRAEERRREIKRDIG